MNTIRGGFGGSTSTTSAFFFFFFFLAGYIGGTCRSGSDGVAPLLSFGSSPCYYSLFFTCGFGWEASELLLTREATSFTLGDLLISVTYPKVIYSTTSSVALSHYVSFFSLLF